MLGAALVAALWITCVAVSVAGQRWNYARPQPSAPEPPPIVAERIDVVLEDAPAPPSPPDSLAFPAEVLPPEPLLLPEPPPVAVTSVALPSPSIAFAVPIEGPVKIVDAPVASDRIATVSSNPPAPGSAAGLPAPVPLRFGQGEGRQPAPYYPRRSVQERQEGTVVVRFVVGTNGRVVSAEAHQPSPWPLLDEEALRTVRGKWRFPEGRTRVYEVAIRFQLKK